jgi:DNA-binding Lrp family transcriptional regulator
MREGRSTNQAFAERVYLSPSACLERWKRLEQAGVIKGYQAERPRQLAGLSVLLAAAGITRTSPQNGRTADLDPDLEGLHPGFSILNGGDMVAVEVEEIVDWLVG